VIAFQTTDGNKEETKKKHGNKEETKKKQAFCNQTGFRSKIGRATRSPFSREFSTHETVKARFGPWIEPFSEKYGQTLLSHSCAAKVGLFPLDGGRTEQRQ